MKKVLFPVTALIIVLALTLALVGSVGAAGIGILKILKKDQDGNALYGATFVISPNPVTGTGDMTVVDNGLNDAANTEDGVLVVTNCNVDSTVYTVCETVAPAGFNLAPCQTGIMITRTAPVVTLTFVNYPFTVGGEAQPINKVGVFAPWLGLAALVIGGMVWFRLRRRSA